MIFVFLKNILNILEILITIFWLAQYKISFYTSRPLFRVRKKLLEIILENIVRNCG